MTSKRMVVLRDAAGLERVSKIGPCKTVRVPVIMDRGFGVVEFVFEGDTTINGLPVYRADTKVWSPEPWLQ